ncbi:hypothetical protein F4779DRAFT_15270 [Xylariaceae sp. FL0662B]|nr:hypothetical protein F4779DRAFT_15270 [Xylariaceae sp. FL0662B]
MAGPAVKQLRKASSKSKVTTTQQHASSNISSFARVSKTVTRTDIKNEPASTPRKNIKIEAITPASRKRKVVATIEDDSSADERPSKPAPTSTSKTPTPTQPTKRGRGRPPKKARPEPAPRKRGRSPSVSDSDASAINSGALFKRLRLESSPSRCSSPLTAATSVDSDAEADTEPTKPRQLPDEVLSRINLHAALLKALTLHYAHNGTNVPADLRALCPHVARAWGKKQVTDADIRLCIGVLNSNNAAAASSQSPFSLSDYGRGKICIELDPSHGSGPLDENKLNGIFRANLERLWRQFTAPDSSSNDDASASAFTHTLPRAPIMLCASVAKASPALSRGQRQLAQLKQDLALKKQAKQTATNNTPNTNNNNKATPPSENPNPNPNPKLSLLDRIRQRAAQKASLPPGLTPAQLSRRAALQRAPEVAAVVGMLSRAAADAQGMASRVSFPMGVVVERVRDSLRGGGISREEAAACVRVLAAEKEGEGDVIAPGWLRVVVVAGRENVVVETEMERGRAEVEERVRGILGRE